MADSLRNAKLLVFQFHQAGTYFNYSYTANGYSLPFTFYYVYNFYMLTDEISKDFKLLLLIYIHLSSYTPLGKKTTSDKPTKQTSKNPQKPNHNINQNLQ